MRRKPLRTCYIRHRFSHWAHTKADYADGFAPEIDPDLQFRMCRRCGHQELREVACVS